MYNGENRSGGAQISYYISIEDEKDNAIKDDTKKEDDEDKSSETSDAKVKWDSVHMNIYDGDRLIRTLKQKAPKESGVHKWTWGMDEKGVDRPSR